ncbi:MAG TPA: MMPL family transporter [Solirubrobacterales bacterium]|nr:MMPL family transporter [Solirubrobacterales bacterium]
MTYRRPLIGLVLVLAAGIGLGIVGLGVEDRLDPVSLRVSGTATSEAEDLARESFGQSSPFIILLRGPAPALDRQGTELVRALRQQSAATTISPWDKGALAALRPGPRRALILVDFHVPPAAAVRDTAPALTSLLERRIRAPVMATQSGFADVSRALQEESLGSTERAELLAAPILILVLLLVFRSVLAAAIPLAFGALTVFAGRGLLVLLGDLVTIDALSLVVCTMMGLALGVDYSLLIVSRFREELEGGATPWEAAARTRGTAGRTTLFAGTTLSVALVFSSFAQPGSLLVSVGLATAVVAAISVAISLLALPPLLALLGPRINVLAIGRRGRRTVAGAAATVLRRPAVAALAVAVPLLLMMTPALGLATNAPGVDELPPSNWARQDAEEIDDVAGPGWEAPFVLLAATHGGPITTPGRLQQLSDLQRRLADLSGVRTVIGPAPVVRRAGPLHRLGATLGDREGGIGQLSRLGPGLRKAAGAVEQLRGGLAEGVQGSGLLAEGSERAGAGAGLLAEGLRRAAAGGAAATDAVGELEDGSRRIVDGQRRVGVGTLSLTLGLRSLLPRLRGGELARARRLARELEQAASADPSLRPLAGQARVLTKAIAANRDEVRRLRGVAQKVNGGVNRLVPGSERLAGGVDRLGAAATGLTAGLRRLGAGSERLATGLGELHGGAAALQQGLESGFHRSLPLQSGLRRAGVRVSAVSTPLRRASRQLNRDAPHLFDSGYFVLSALDGAPARRRQLAGEAISLHNGGQAARLVIVTTHPFSTEGSRRIGRRLQAEAERVANQTGMRTGVSGGAATLNTYGSATRARLPLAIAAFILLTLLVLVILLRAPVLALITVLLNLASVTAALGVVALVCRLPADYPLGGHPYIDTVGAAGIFGITFGLSIDYAVFLIARMREHYDVHGDNRAAIDYGLRTTAGVVTGAAAIMAGVFVSFATAPIATVSQMGIGLTVAILLDATIIRIVLLPALMLLLGDRVWWTPAALDRIVPPRKVLHPGEGAAEA